MATQLQDFTIYAGDDSAPVFVVLSANGNPISISGATEITWVAQKNLSSTAAITKKKSTNGIAFTTNGTDGKFTVTITKSDSAGLSGFYMHEATITDASGNVTTVTLGRMQVGRAPSWSYDPSSLATSVKDQVRFHLGDTDESSPQVFDEEINFAVGLRGTAYGAAALCARALVAKYSRLVSMSADGVSQQFSNLAHQFAILAAELEAKVTIFSSAPYAGGISIADMRAMLANTDRVPELFRIGLFDNPPSDGTDPSVDRPGSGPSQGLGPDGDGSLPFIP